MSAATTAPLRWGILGTAHIATKVSQAMHQANNVELHAIASRDLTKAQTWAAEHNVKHAYGRYEALLDDPQIDAVYIPLPPSMHMEWTIKAAIQGKHVLCEKPLTLNADQARVMAAACQQHGVQLMDGVMWVHHQRTQAMKTQIDTGKLGPLRRITAAFSFNWDQLPTANIRTQNDLGGGAMGDLGYYCVRAILWAYETLPTRVYATARFYNEVDFNLSALLWFTDGRMASFDCGFDTVTRKWFEIAGTLGSLVCDDFVVPHTEQSARFWLHGANGASAGEHKVDNCIQEVRMMERFAAQVATGQLEAAWPRQAIDTMQVCDALLTAVREDRPVELEPEN